MIVGVGFSIKNVRHGAYPARSLVLQMALRLSLFEEAHSGIQDVLLGFLLISPFSSTPTPKMMRVLKPDVLIAEVLDLSTSLNRNKLLILVARTLQMRIWKSRALARA